ncbi:carbamoyl phosphate synthase large subunit [Buchnera aphidicola (Nipponaphis monzeni)]|uniref:Carbamoyl phosphate synthase large chain n=1 Tax=Buchnera aphidicola (Nipponaphis monzeni) TaxID=2495405 RepID=A0A455T9Y0_9GAMM|nr:carbamoyl-phosphate synthase large subunit [Buchnera aphidicola]BBI01129.1 carbamoyl phosphate synthase large subunit [Buchnera aphidicola (Nipponaphis monzeni)]
MPKRTDIKSILILGAGPIVIGQACEFDYSGTQACKALKEEGYKIILVNSNPATIMTDPDIANVTYIEPIHWKIIYEIIKKERPNAILPTMGGQTALNCALLLDQKGILSKFNVEMIGVTVEAIKNAEDRYLFQKSMKKINLKTAKCDIANNMQEALKIVSIIGLPCIIRPSFTMGGSGGGIAYNVEEFKNICTRGFVLSSNHQVLIDEFLIGWKEFEMEVIRDTQDNCIIVCSIENIDPMGIHTGDSITVTPAQTLTDKEYQLMRNSSIAVLKEIGIKSGGSNVQFAINPVNGQMVVIEMNPRVSRSSALASKATGFPIAKIVAKLSIGYTLDELVNDITKNSCIPAAFEPTIDYIVTKIPRFNFEKFPGCNDRLTTQMKSVGEVMGIGRTFQESIQKAICSLEVGKTGLNSKIINFNEKAIRKIIYELKEAGPERIWYVADAFRSGMSIQEVHQLTYIDKWFLSQILELIVMETSIEKINLSKISFTTLKNFKRKGFSDCRLGELTNTNEKKIRELRQSFNLQPTYKRIDTCAAEFPTKTSYMYSTWEQECESKPSNNKNKIIILGSGPNRIGQGIEFDYCCIHASIALRENGFETIMINCNPETISTDYDISDRLYFEPIILENILNIVEIEQPLGVIIQYGGQTPLKLSNKLEKYGVPIIGTSPHSIDKAENRDKFQAIVKKLGLNQPLNASVFTFEEALEKISSIGYPIIIRPSYVLGGQFMKIIYDNRSLKDYFKNLECYKQKQLILIDQYITNAIEIDVDAICDGKQVFIGGIMEHVEGAGIHSGDSACSIPAYTISQNIQNNIKSQVKKLAFALSVIGLINVQFAIKNKVIYIIEVNPRASRTIPFISKAIGLPLAKIAALVMCGFSLLQQKIFKEIIPYYYFVKEAILPFNKFPNVNPILGPEMCSTGEVMGIGKNFSEAFAKALLAAQSNIKKNGRVLLSIHNDDKKNVVNLAIKLKKFGFKIDATYGTAMILKKSGIYSRIVNKINECSPNVYDRLKNGEYNYIVDTISSHTVSNKKSSQLICYFAIHYKVYFNTTINGAFATLMAINEIKTFNVRSLQNIYKKNLII